MINFIIVAVTILVGALILIWWLYPLVRPWMEAPKHRFLAQEARIESARRKEVAGSDQKRPEV
ncbi:MAG: hypothetical protein ACYC6M_14200 [Terriglobales bacterium]